MLISQKKRDLCTKSCFGKVIKLNKDLLGPTTMIVEYTVRTETYKVKEGIVMKTPKGLPKIMEYTAKASITAIPNLKVGTRVTVKYNPEDPSMSYIKENK